jgi:hypothetical protein
MTEVTDLKKGDFVGFVFGQPGNDTTYLVVMQDAPMAEANPNPDLDKVKCYDIWFDFEIEIRRGRLFHLSEKNLAESNSHYKYGVVTARERLEHVKATMCVPNNQK